MNCLMRCRSSVRWFSKQQPRVIQLTTLTCIFASLLSKPTVGKQWTWAVMATASSVRLRSNCVGLNSCTVSRAKRPFNGCGSTTTSWPSLPGTFLKGTLTPMSIVCPKRARTSRVTSKSSRRPTPAMRASSCTAGPEITIELSRRLNAMMRRAQYTWFTTKRDSTTPSWSQGIELASRRRPR